MRNLTALNEWGLIDTHALALYACLNYLYTHTRTGAHTLEASQHLHWRKAEKSATSVFAELD